MSTLVGWSPWSDAAAYGQGLGQTLAQAMLQMPLLRNRQQMEQQRLGMEQQQFPLQQQLLQAQISRERQLPDIERMRYQNTAALNQRRLESMDVNDEYKQAQINKMGQSKATTPNQQIAQEKQVTENIPTTYQGKPLNVDPNVVGMLMKSYQQGGLAGLAQVIGGMQKTPQMTTNQVPAYAGGGMNPMNWFSQPINQPVTNSFTLGQPQGMQQAAPPPEARKVGQVVTTAKGTFEWDGTGWRPIR